VVDQKAHHFQIAVQVCLTGPQPKRGVHGPVVAEKELGAPVAELRGAEPLAREAFLFPALGLPAWHIKFMT
jgi:hypothetical protein